MRRWFSLLPIALCGLNVLFAACASDDPAAPGPKPATSDDGATGDLPGSPDAGAEAGPVVEAGKPTASFRVAHLAADMPAFDVCVLPRGTTSYQGPLIRQLSGLDGGAPGISFGEVSAYLAVAPGPYDLRIVPAGSTTCRTSAQADGGADADAGDASTDDDAADGDSGDAADASDTSDADSGGLNPSSVRDITDLRVLDANTYATVLVAGDAFPVGSDHGLTVSMVFDDVTLAGGAAALRAINALPSAPLLDFGLGSATKWTALLTSVPFGAAGMHAGPGEGAVDPNGYLPIAPFSAEVIGVRVSSDAATDTIVAHGATIPHGAVATVIAIGGKTGDAAHPPSLLLCIDNEPSGGILSDCSIAR